MGQHGNKKNLKLALSLLFMTAIFSPLKSSSGTDLTWAKTPVSYSKVALISNSGSDSSTFHSPEVDSLLLIIAIMVLGLTSVIGYYIVTNRKGPH